MAEDPVGDVVWMIRGVWVTMAIRAGCRLGVFDHLVEPRTLTWLAVETGSGAGSLGRLLRALDALGLVEERPDGRLVDTAQGSTLTADHPSGLRSLALIGSWLPQVAAWNHLDVAVREGTGVYERVNGVDFWGHLSAHPDQEALFNRSMARRAEGQIATIAASLDLSEVDSVVDVGGGRGAMLTGVLHAWPHLVGVVADRPDVAAEADAAFAENGLERRARAVGGDFFESVPPDADVYFLSSVLHDWDDEDCRRILRTVRRAMHRDSRVILVERVLGSPGRSAAEDRDLALVDLHMLLLFGAQERSLAEYDALLGSVGLSPGVLVGTGGSWDLIESRPVTETGAGRVPPTE